MKKILLAGTLTGLLLSVQVASATPTFTFNHAAGMDANALAGFTQAGAIWSSLLGDNVNLSIDIGFGALGSGNLAQAVSASQKYTYSNVRSALIADAKSANDTTATSHLQSGPSLDLLINGTADSPKGWLSSKPYLDNNGSVNNTTIEMTTANAKALGLGVSGSGPDASITFSSAFTWDFDRSNGIGSTSYDFVGVAVHEIGHALGFISGVDMLDYYSYWPFYGFKNEDFYTNVTPLDFFRFSDTSYKAKAGGVIDWTADKRTKYFSIDGGATSFLSGQFSTGSYYGDGRQASHWKDSLGLGIMDPSGGTGELLNISQLDLTAMDVIGWDMVVPHTSDPVPEPSTLLLSGIGLAALGFYRRKRRS
jgi:hypothetical protein